LFLHRLLLHPFRGSVLSVVFALRKNEENQKNQKLLLSSFLALTLRTPHATLLSPARAATVTSVDTPIKKKAGLFALHAVVPSLQKLQPLHSLK
jgi:type II secretory pathway component PulL